MSLYTADFETTTTPEDCRVWAWGIMDIDNIGNFNYGNRISDFMSYIKLLVPATLYFHNLKFDGEFLLTELFKNGFKHVKTKRELEKNTFTTLISDKGQFYSMEICFGKKGTHNESIVIYDSLKIIPFPVAKVAETFNLPILKGEIDYDLYREVGHVLTQEELSYLKNDVEIMARALKVLFSQGLTKMTQGANALYDYKRIIGKSKFVKWFPIPDYDGDIRQAYKGGFTYLNPKFKGVDIGEGLVFDINSLYPYVMYTEPLPYGEGIYFKGQYQPDPERPLYICMITCQFELKENYIPTIQLKNNLSFVPTQYITSSKGEDVTMCLTNVDLELFLEHYNVYNIDYHSGWKFRAAHNMFKDYIDKWIKIKIESSENGNGGMRTLAKLMLNALYGKFGTNPNVRSKYPYFRDGQVGYITGEQETREPIYIPMAVFITSWARNKTIRSAQQCFDRFIYADTDSLHIAGTEIPEFLDIHPTRLGAWKHESTFTRARFIRQKSYIEEIDGKLNITCAGLPERCYPYVTFDNFRSGASYGGKLTFKHVRGGVVLSPTEFTIKK